jgi:hypothetical protein
VRYLKISQVPPYAPEPIHRQGIWVFEGISDSAIPPMLSNGTRVNNSGYRSSSLDRSSRRSTSALSPRKLGSSGLDDMARSEYYVEHILKA